VDVSALLKEHGYYKQQAGELKKKLKHLLASGERERQHIFGLEQANQDLMEQVKRMRANQSRASLSASNAASPTGLTATQQSARSQLPLHAVAGVNGSRAPSAAGESATARSGGMAQHSHRSLDGASPDDDGDDSQQE
jgi:hypothetical protein